MILGCTSFTSFAEAFGDEYQYDSLEEAVDRIEAVEKDNVVTTAEKREFVNEISPEVMSDLVEEAYDEAAEKACELQANFRIPIEGDFEPFVKEEKYDLDVGGSVDVKIVVEPTPELEINPTN